LQQLRVALPLSHTTESKKEECMKLAHAIEGGLAGASTLTLLQQTLHKKRSTQAPVPLHKSGLIKEFRKAGKKKKGSPQLYIKLAGELLANAAAFGLTAIGKKKNAVLRGALLGAGAGLGVAFLQDATDSKEDNGTLQAHESTTKSLYDQLFTIGLYTAGGALAGYALKKWSGKKKKKK
jgi:hypothetical protein